MTQIQLSSRSDRWFTPKYITDLVHEVLPQIDLDPASCHQANQLIKAKKFFNSDDNALNIERWAKVPVTIYLNPPGGKLGNKSITGLFWQRLMALRGEGLLKEAIFMGFSLEHLAVTQGYDPSVCNFPVCLPRKRIRFVSPDGNFNSPTHSSVIAYIPGISNNTRQFKDVFSELGAIMNPDQPA